MNKKQTTMLASIAAVTLVGTMLLLSGIFGKAIAFNPTGAPDYTLTPSVPNQVFEGTVTKLFVEIDSPFGFEQISSFKLFQTDNLMKQSGYYTLRLFGPIMNDKRTLLHWIANDMGKLPDGLYIQMPITTGGGKPAIMTKPKEGVKIDTIPLTGKVTLYLLEGYQDMHSNPVHAVRQFEFLGCHVAGYNLGTNYDDEKSYFRDGIQHFEEVDFACTKIKDLKSQNTNSRGIVVDRAINNDNREVINEKGELVITSREYRQPIVIENFVQEGQKKPIRQEIVTSIVSDKTNYKIGDTATFSLTFTDLEGTTIDPDTIKAYYDGKIVQLERLDIGVYTYTTLGLTKAHHQLIVSAEKTDYATDTKYLTIPIHRIS